MNNLVLAIYRRAIYDLSAALETRLINLVFLLKDR